MYQTTDFRRVIIMELEARGLLRRDLAQAIGRSEAWVSLMLKGRPLDPELTEPIAAFFGFDAEQTRYFGALVDIENPSPRARQAAWATVQATQQQQQSAEQFTEDVASAYGCWYVQAIGELARCEGFRADPTWIASVLQPQITIEQAAEALTRLVRIGVLVPDEQGGLQASGKDAWSPTMLPRGIISEAAARYHTDAAALSQQALRAARNNERHHGGMVFAISEDQYPAVEAALHELERHLVLAAQQAPGTPNRVYLLGLQLFPISQFTDCEPESLVEPPTLEEPTPTAEDNAAKG